MSDESVDAELDRDIGIVGAIALGVGTMIAAGIFVLSGLAVADVGAMAIASFVLAAIVASFTAFAYAEFAAIYPESGGGYAYVSNTFDTDLTYIVGWSMILGYPASAAFYLASFSDWFDRFILPLLDLGAAVPYWASGLVILALLVALNLKGTEESGKFQIAVTALKVALIAVFLYGGLQTFEGAAVMQSVAENTGSLANYRDIAVTSALVFITFFGFEAIATNAEEIKDPGRTIPRAIFFSMGFVTVVYTLVVLVVVLALQDGTFLSEFLPANAELGGLAPAEYVRENGEIAMGYAASYYLGDVGFYVIIVGALFSMLSAANATVLAGSRVKLAMSRRGHLPSRFETLHDRFNTPYYSVLLTGGLITFFILLFTVVFGGGEGEAALPLPMTLPFVGESIHLGVEAIAHFADFMLLAGLIVVNVAVIRSRKKYPDIERAFEVPFVPVVPVVAILANLVLLVNVEPGAFLLGIAAELVGVAFYLAVLRGPDVERIEKEAPTVVSETPPAETDYRVVVPIANPAHVEQLMRTATDLARANDGEILVTSVVELPEQTPLSEGYQYVDERREVLRRAMALTDGGAADVPADGDDGDRDGEAPAAVDDGTLQSVPVGGTVRIAHDVADAINHTVAQHDADAVLMGWSGRASRRRDIVLGSVVDEVLANAGCDVLVERIGEGSVADLDSILLPTAGGPNAEYAAAVGTAIARANDATVEVVRVVAPDASQHDREDAERTVQETADAVEGVEVVETVVESDDVVDALVERSGDHDLTIIGATREGLLQEFVLGAIPEGVAREAGGTVIMAKRDLGIPSRIRRVLRWE